MGPMGPRTLDLVRDVGWRIAMETGEHGLHLSVAVQRGNCASDPKFCSYTAAD